MKIIMVRHPETIANQQHIIAGKRDYPYTLVGKRQVKAIAGYFREEYIQERGSVQVISSPASRAQNLAKAIAIELDVDVVIEASFREMDFGLFEGHTFQEAKEKYPHVYAALQQDVEGGAIPGGERYDDFQKRIRKSIKKVVDRQHLDDTYILVSHGGVIREILEQLLPLSPGDSWKFGIYNGVLVEINQQGDGYVIEQIRQFKEKKDEERL